MKTISVRLLIATIICSCNARDQNPTVEQMMARADSIDSMANLRKVAMFRADSTHMADSASVAYEYQKYHDSLKVEQGYP